MFPIWIAFAILKYLVLDPIGLVAVPLSRVSDGRHRTPYIWWLWGNDEPGFRNQDLSVMDLLIDRIFRNPVGNSKYLLEKIFGDPQDYIQYGSDIDEGYTGFQWRYRRVGLLDSIRVVWGKPRKQGKKEIYIGFKIGSNVPGFGITAQFRLL